MKLTQIRSTDGTGTLSYVVMDESKRNAAVIDPNKEDLEQISNVVDRAGVRLTGIIDTHTHADHITGAGELRKRYGAEVIMHENTKHKWRIVDEGDKFGIGDTLRANAEIPIDRYVVDGDVIPIGGIEAKVLFTPGHTDNHITLLILDNIFTGDLILVGQAGRSDLPGGNPEEQYDSLMHKILPLPDSTRMYPGHDYEENEFSLLGDEKKNNPFLQPRTKTAYVEFVQQFFPPLAEAIASGDKMTLQCGVARVPRPTDRFKNVTASDLAGLLKAAKPLLLLDVREPHELVMTGAIDGVVNIPVGQLPRRLEELPPDKSLPIVCICATGNRSMEAAHFLQKKGYTGVMNLLGGTVGWIRGGMRVVRPSKA